VKLGYSTITWGGVVGHPGGVTSIKDLFYMTHGDTAAALTDIAEAGYQGTELFDGNLAEFENEPEVLLTALRESGLEQISSMTRFLTTSFSRLSEPRYWLRSLAPVVWLLVAEQRGLMGPSLMISRRSVVA
jgi:sugar phosphate isomerase/epimerase